MKITAILALVAVSLMTSGLAFASHKAWLLKNSGADCQFTFPTAADTVTTSGSLNNSSASDRDVNCPLTLASRWGSNGTAVFDAKTWADARSALVYLNRQGSTVRTVSCYASMQATDGSTYYSATVSNIGGAGIARVDLATQSGGQGRWASDASGTLEQNENLYAVSLAFQCTLPPSTSVLGVKAKMCQITGDCFDTTEDAENDQHGGTSNLSNYVQTSGIECSATEFPSKIFKTEDGIKNTGTSARRVFCPIAPSADDSYEHLRDVRFTSVRYSGGSDASNCIALGTCPSCTLTWYGRDGVVNNSAVIPKDSSASRLLYSSTKVSVGNEVGMGVLCSLPGGTTLEGLTTSVTVNPVQQLGQ